MIIKFLRNIIISDTTKFGKVFNIFIIFLIIISLLSFSLETIPGLNKEYNRILQITEVIIVIIFSLEYILRLSLNEKKLKYFFSFYGLIDLFAILPFYLSSGVDLRSIRIVRIFRVFRILKLVRYSKALQRYKDAFILIKAELAIFLVAAFFLLYISAVGIYYFENEAQPDKFSSVFDALWWSIVTLTTVGYGDVFPITTGGKIFTAFIILIGLGFISVPTGLIASALTRAIKKDETYK